MSTKIKSNATYKTPLSKAYWIDAAAELKDTKMLVVTALMIALRVALKPLAIPLGPQLSIQTAMLATALGAMIYGPVVAIPAAMISDTVGFMIYPTGDYFLPFMLTEIASTMFYAIFLYRAEKVTPLRVMLSRFCICLFVNVILQQFIYAWWYSYIGNPEKAKEQILGIMTLSRILKNVAMFPIESVVLTLFLRFLMPVVKRAKLIYSPDDGMKFDAKQVTALVLLMVIGAGTATLYLSYRYSTSSRSADYSAEERVAANHMMQKHLRDNNPELFAEDAEIITIVDSAYRGMFDKDTDYTVSVYVLDEAAFAAGQAADEDYTIDTLWAYSKSGPKKDKYQSLQKLGELTFTQNEDTLAISDWNMELLGISSTYSGS